MQITTKYNTGEYIFRRVRLYSGIMAINKSVKKIILRITGRISRMYITKRCIDIPIDEKNTLLINTISSAIDIVDSPTRSLIKKIEQKQECDDLELTAVLKERGYIFLNEADEEAFIKKYATLHDKAMSHNFVRNYTICPTMGCNLRCIYCFEGEGNHRNNKKMPETYLQTILKYIRKEIGDAKKVGAKTNAVISLYGGEPLLPSNKDIIEYTLRFAKENGVEVRIITNGTTIQHFLDIFKEYSNLITVQITLDGDRDIHDKRRVKVNQEGTFNEIVSNIDTLIQLGIKTHLRTNVNRDNISSISNLIKFIKEKKWVETGIVYPYVAPVLDYCDGTDNSMKESELYRKILELEPDMGSQESIIKMVSSPCINFLNAFFNSGQSVKPWKLNYCEATSGNNLVFSPDGNISTCLMLAGKGQHQIGRFDEHGVQFYKEEVKKWSERNILRIPKCRKCKYGLICGGGCSIAALDINNDIDCSVCSDIEETIKVFVESKKKTLFQGM